MFAEGLYNFLSTNAAIKAQVGTSGSSVRGDKTSGVFPVQAPDEPTLPFVAYIEISGAQDHVYGGANRLAITRWRLACWGSTAKSAKVLANVVKFQFNGFRGTFSEGTVVENVMDILEADTTDDLPHGTVFGSHVDFEIAYLANADGS